MNCNICEWPAGSFVREGYIPLCDSCLRTVLLGEGPQEFKVMPESSGSCITCGGGLVAVRVYRDGIPVGGGVYTAVWADSADNRQSCKDCRYRLRVKI